MRPPASLAISPRARAGAPGPGLDIDRVLAHVDALAASARVPVTAPARARRARLHRGAARCRLHANASRVGEVELPAIDGARQRRTAMPSASRPRDPDLVVRFGPPGKALLVMAHYDTVRGQPRRGRQRGRGRLLIELARALRDPAAGATGDARVHRERGERARRRRGTRRQRGDDIEFAIALDLVGGGGQLVAQRREQADRREPRCAGSPTPPIAPASSSRAAASSRGQPVVAASRARRSRRVHAARHPRVPPLQPRPGRRVDRPRVSLAARHACARRSRSSLDGVGRLLLALADEPPPAHDGDGFWLPLAANTVVPRWLAARARARARRARDRGLVLAASVRARTRRSRPRRRPRLLPRSAIAVARAHRSRPALGARAASPRARRARADRRHVRPRRRASRRAVRPWVGSSATSRSRSPRSLAIGLAWLAARRRRDRLGVARARRRARDRAAPSPTARARSRCRRCCCRSCCVLAPPSFARPPGTGFCRRDCRRPCGWVCSVSRPWRPSAGWLRRGSTPGPLGTLVLALGCGLAVISGVAGRAPVTATATLHNSSTFGSRASGSRTWP